MCFLCVGVGWDSAVGIASRYGKEGPRIESRWGRDLLTHSDWPGGPPNLLYTRYRVSFMGVKAGGVWR